MSLQGFQASFIWYSVSGPRERELRRGSIHSIPRVWAEIMIIEISKLLKNQGCKFVACWLGSTAGLWEPKFVLGRPRKFEHYIHFKDHYQLSFLVHWSLGHRNHHFVCFSEAWVNSVGASEEGLHSHGAENFEASTEIQHYFRTTLLFPMVNHWLQP